MLIVHKLIQAGFTKEAAAVENGYADSLSLQEKDNILRIRMSLSGTPYNRERANAALVVSTTSGWGNTSEVTVNGVFAVKKNSGPFLMP